MGRWTFATIMRIQFSIYLILSLILLSFKYSSPKFQIPEYVECYFDKENKLDLVLFDSINGSSFDTLQDLTEEMCWYKLAVSENYDDWFKIENVSVFPACMDHPVNKRIDGYQGKWIKTFNLCINIADMDLPVGQGIKFYSEPNLNSKIVFTSGKFQKTRLIEIQKNWAKVKFQSEGKDIIGWLQKGDQCPYPWTSCPKSTH